MIHERDATPDLRALVVSGDLDLRGLGSGPLDLTGLRVAAPSRLLIDAPIRLNGALITSALVIDAGGLDAAIVSLEDAVLTATLVVGEGVQLSACRFVGASGLQHLRVMGRQAWPRVGRRRAVADEVGLGSADRVGGQAVQAVYAQLAPALRDSGGAGDAVVDFATGELDLRRRAARRWSGERVLLGASRWLTGYGLRPLRPLAAYAVLLTVVTWLFRYRTGRFVGGPYEAMGGDVIFTRWWSVFIECSLRATLDIAGPLDTRGFHTEGTVLYLTLRTVGPLLLALAALAALARVRGRRLLR